LTPRQSGEANRIRAAALDALKACYDPEAGLNVVDMGLIVELSVKDDRLRVTMTGAVRSSPTEGWLVEEVKRRVEDIEGVRGAEVVLVWDPPWTPRQMTDGARVKLGLSAQE
jgi:metal-sulfur cluster biosynthetic enzyme